jgi:hypothetical protein
MRVRTLRISAALVVASIALAGCSTPEDLFACNLLLSCEENVVHVSDEPPCDGSLAASGKPGVLLGTADPGPWLDQTQFLLILRGDGTAMLQIRERHCSEGCTIPTDEVPWETPTEQWQCSVVLGVAARPDTCSDDTSEPCAWWPWTSFGLTNCTPIDPELSCNDANAILAQ